MTRRLPVVRGRVAEQTASAALETCAYCPKLCRSACPISEATHQEGFTPWGMMTSAWLAERGALGGDDAQERLIWGCSGCHACTDFCEHKNPVAGTLYRERAVLGAETATAKRALDNQPPRAEQALRRARQLSQKLALPERARTALLVGCGYFNHAPDVAEAVVRSVAKLAGSVQLVGQCCGAAFEMAGDEENHTRSRLALERALDGVQELVVYDPGCAVSLSQRSVVPLLRWLAERRERIRPVAAGGRPWRYHDPCQLSRGLGETVAPRQLLTQLGGEAPLEFTRSGAQSFCSGGGGLLPLTLPEVSEDVARLRVAEHETLGGGTIVTACAASLRRFRKQGVPALDLMSLVWEGLE